MADVKQKKNHKRESRWERLDWILTIGELLLYVPRLFGRVFRKIFDSF